ncbi:MAG: MFS transporter [Rhodoplanes sp.]|uniref:MFS transporter n=1 Tax=Rhodoplanes sp. TaxID=1968906 RepID=UPI00185AC0A1|nr:MFS transporter [Rhodoplanes sp.]NVO15730.1 MFS transporter [Rhodoplanes sp.]
MSGVTIEIPASPTKAVGAGLTREQKKNLALASLGSFLEFYEFMVFGFFTVVIAKLFFPPDLPDAVKTFHAFALYSLGFLLRPVSGAIIGHLGDKFGRKRMFVITIFIMAVPTTLIGLMPTYAQIGILAPILLLVLRLVQGVAIAGEFAGASVFVSEHVPVARLATANGWLLGSTWLGFFFGAASGAVLANLLSPADLEAWGWRIPFVVGGVFGLVSVYLRRSLDETPLFKALHARRDLAKASPFRDAIRMCPGRMAYVAGLASYLGTMIIILYFYMPTFLAANYGFDRASVFTANATALLVASALCPLWGRVADKVGYGLVLGLGATALGVALFAFFQQLESIAATPGVLIWWYLGFSVLMATAGVVPLLSAAPFPTELRLTGFGFGYNVGIVISAAAPTIMAWIVLSYGRQAVAWFALLVGMVGLVLSVMTSRIPLMLDKEHVR